MKPSLFAFSQLEIQSVWIALECTIVGLGTKWEAASFVSSISLDVCLEGIATDFRGKFLNKSTL